MRHALWPEMSEAENTQETKALGRRPEGICQTGAGSAGEGGWLRRSHSANGLCERLRDIAGGLSGRIYVHPWARRQGAARRLVEVVQQWAQQMKCSEMASDALLENTDSHGMHLGLGFEETERVVYFRKVLTQ
jgi:aminoglycoside 6'-N-acetyltransferase I